MDVFVAPVVTGYRLGTLIGRGGSAAVWGGRRAADGRSVAIKVVPMPPGGEDAAVRELGFLRGLGAEHVVSLLDAVPVSDPADALALVMDRYDGGSLAQVVDARGRLTAGEIVTALSPVAAALGGLHRAGVVHGDLTAGNVLFDETGRPAICDLGVTRIIGDRPGEVFGTKGFLAPEVSVGEQPTTASDVYAVGALAWFCATGEAPEPGWLRQDTTEALADLPPTLVDVIDACLAADPASRPGAVELSVDLFASAEAEPMRLPGTADDVESLTRRIRAHANASALTRDPAIAPPARSRRRWWPRAGRRPVETVVPAQRPARTAGLAPDDGGRHRSGARRRFAARSWAATAVLAATLVTIGGLVAIATGWEPGSGLPHHVGAPVGAGPATGSVPRSGTESRSAEPRSAAPTPRPTPKPTPPFPTRSEPTSASAVVAADLLSPTAAVTDPRGTAQALADARATVWTSRDLTGLVTVDAPGSGAWADDARRIQEATAGGWRYEGVRFTVRAASLGRHSATTASVHVVLDSAAYVVVGPHGAEQRPAEAAQARVLDLVHTTAGWRVSRVSS